VAEVRLSSRMIIRSEQLARMDEALQKRYHDELRKVLCEQSPQLTARLDDRALLDRIAAAAQKARSYGVRTGEGILAYVGLSIAAGPAFHDDPKISSFLKLQGDDPDVKVRWLFTRVVESLQSTVNKGGSSKLG
jgi:hypothetical protein